MFFVAKAPAAAAEAEDCTQSKEDTRFVAMDRDDCDIGSAHVGNAGCRKFFIVS
jgi:hypothetical protein